MFFNLDWIKNRKFHAVYACNPRWVSPIGFKHSSRSISRSLSHHMRKEYIFDPSDFRRLRLHEAIFKGFDGERIIGPARVYLKPYSKARGVSYSEEAEGRLRA